MTKKKGFNLGLIDQIGSQRRRSQTTRHMLVCNRHSRHGCRLFINYGLHSFHSHIFTHAFYFQPSVKSENL